MKKLFKWQKNYLQEIKQYGFYELIEAFENQTLFCERFPKDSHAWRKDELRREILKRWEGKSND